MPAATRSTPPSSETARALTPEQARAAIALAQGRTVTAAADAIGVHRSTLYNWFKDDPAFRRAVDEIRRERYERINDEMRDLESLALSRVRRILEEDSVPAAIQLRAAMLVLTRPVDSIGIENWHMPRMENFETTLEHRPGLLKTPETCVVRQISTLFVDQPASAIEITRQNSTDFDALSTNPPLARPALLPHAA
jgi:AcrR family transcriptional regulator